jgi:general secretion pathway protein K
MMARLDRDTLRTRLLMRDTQAEFYAQGSIAWAIDQLKGNLEKQKPNQIIDAMPAKSPVNEANGYKISATIYDMQARFNLNNLTNADAQADFVRLLKTVDPAIQELKAQEIARATAEWIAPAQQQNEFSKYYLEQVPPYSAAHRAMTSASELLLVKGMSPRLYILLRPYVIALPVVTQVNVQTAAAPVLTSLNPTMTLETAQAIERMRVQTPIVSAESFQSLDLIKNHPVPAEKITTTSSYFLVETTVAIEKQKLVLYTLLERAAKGSKPDITILWQSKSQPG